MSDFRDPADAGPPPPAYSIDNPPPQRSAEAEAQAAWRKLRASPVFSPALFGHLRPTFIERAPVRLYGIDGGRFLYRDASGRRRMLRARDHHRAGIAALFSGAEEWLCRLWPAAGFGWDHRKAAETLMHFNACIGPVDAVALGFDADAA